MQWECLWPPLVERVHDHILVSQTRTSPGRGKVVAGVQQPATEGLRRGRCQGEGVNIANHSDIVADGGQGLEEATNDMEASDIYDSG